MINIYTNYFYLITMLACYVSFWWSVVAIFKLKDSRLDQLYKILKIFSLFFWSYSLYLWNRQNTPMSFAIFGALINLTSLGLFWWSSHYIKNKSFSVIFGKDIPQSLETQGPFRFVRHPFYTSYLICYLANTICLSSIVLSIIFVALLTVYLIAIKIEESKFFQSPHIHEFIKYRSQTGALFPKFKKQLFK